MKKSLSMLTLLIPVILTAQSVGINTDNSMPDNNAILDIKSDSKGVLIPRLTTLQRTSIMGPALGLTVYDTDTFSFWYYAGDLYGGWLELMNSHPKHLDRNGSNIFNNNNGNIGIGTSTPTEKLSVNAVNLAILYVLKQD